MGQLYIISKDQFSEYEDVAINIEVKRLQVFIKKAQDLDLKPFMGQAFFYAFLATFNADGTQKDNAEQIYKDLYIGCDYEDRQGNPIHFDGIIPALVYFTFARFIEADSFRFTATGPVIKQHEEADTLKSGDIAKLVSQQRSTANAHLNDVITFLDTKRTIYQLWRYSERNANARQPGPRIRSVDATNVRNRGYDGYNNGYYNGLINDLI